MTQGRTRGPREYKFVTAFGRRNTRRRGVNRSKPVQTHAETASSSTATAHPDTHCIEGNINSNSHPNSGSRTGSKENDRCQERDAKYDGDIVDTFNSVPTTTCGATVDHAAANLLMGLHTDGAAESTSSATDRMEDTATCAETAITSCASANNESTTVNEPGHGPYIPDIRNMYFDPPLNLFSDFDPGFNFPADPSTWYANIPFLPEPNGIAPFQLLGDPPSAESSSNCQVSGHHGTDDAMVTDSDLMPKAPQDLLQSTTSISLLPFGEPCENGLNIGHTISQLLTRYDKEFCVLPLTRDFDANPFRFDSKTGRGSQLLLHCILAVCYKHISRDSGDYEQEAKTHKRQAFDLLKDVEKQAENQLNSPVRASLLDALLILMTLDCATSARGPWIWYLQRAHKMIEATASDDIQDVSRFQARIEMLVWWDVTLALTSRQGCVLSEATTMSLMVPDKTDGAGLFFSISGCPRDLFQYMIKLAAYAREYEAVSNMTCVAFDMKHVNSVQSSIRAWKNSKIYESDIGDTPTKSSPDDGKALFALQDNEDLYHCAEAWRNALLLYVEQVFCRDRTSRSPIPDFLARRTLNHVSCCRRSSMVQKQLLLPVFLSGCETKDETLREQARSYCAWWDERARYGMFSTATDIMEDLWHANDSSLWWGRMLDQKSRENGSSQIPRQYLFG